MSRREEVLRIGATVLILAALVFLFLRDRSADEPGAEQPEPTVSTPTDAPEVVEPSDPSPEVPDAPDAPDTVPSPPEGLAELVCEENRTAVDLRVMSFNTHRSTGTLDAVAGEILALEPDVVLLQEVDRRMLRSGSVDQAEVLAEAVGMDGSFSANLVRGTGHYGTLVLSRFDIVQQGRIGLVRGPGAEARGLQWVTLEVAGQAIRVYNTHLEATDADVRLAQARQVAGVLAEDELPVVLGGDLNAWPASAAVATIARELTDTWTASGQGRSATSSGGRKIDYLFVRGMRPLLSQVAPSGVSDHHRLWADVRLPAPDTCDTASPGPAG
ncbi:endonuclease/exonuclease/phosphatase family protein [Nocardioides sp. SYSU D00065]|uniref:endonuclease/exonuclease/phosphatase family protein n=1 Tax=Nocardioides sp. SYSU D00065 TaxID=2817378 RepID=UPI001B31D80C|nr:endonuclease/exonuclease/phosphatase family protein [Nocardioides sp. SYSU D00065]